jgi:Zn finger protein HypA/HybF involved in hydrogenase expression
MHELSLVEDLVTEVRRRAKGRTVLEVWARCPVSVDSGELSDNFTFLTSHQTGAEEGTSLRRAQLKLVTTPLFMQCPCGFEGELAAGEFAGHIGICPDCDRVAEIDAALELVAMSYAEVEPFGAG